MIPQEYVQEVVRRTDIVDLIGSYVQLRHRGRTQTGLCPFHNEKTPSFVVYPENQSFSALAAAWAATPSPLCERSTIWTMWRQ